MTFSTYQYDHEYRCGQYDRYIEEKYQSNYCVPKSVKGHKSVPKNVKGENSVPNFSITLFITKKIQTTLNSILVIEYSRHPSTLSKMRHVAAILII